MFAKKEDRILQIIHEVLEATKNIDSFDEWVKAVDHGVLRRKIEDKMKEDPHRTDIWAILNTMQGTGSLSHEMASDITTMAAMSGGLQSDLFATKFMGYLQDSYHTVSVR